MMTRKCFEWILVFFIACGYCIMLLIDSKLIAPFFVIVIKEIEGQMNTIFQVQASIVTLGIALISLLSGASKEMVFGIPVSHYIMQKKPFIFTHKNSILVELTLIIISYYLIALNYYNTLITNFIFSIIIIVFMTCDIFMVFYGPQHIKGEIKEYCLKYFGKSGTNDQRKDILAGLYRDIEYSLEIKNYMRIKDNLRTLEDCFITLINNGKADIILWEDSYTNICIKLFEQKNGDISSIAVDSVCRIYEGADIRNNLDLILHIWDKIDRDFFKEITNIKPTDLNIINRLHWNLYYSLRFLDGKQKNNLSLNSYASYIYFILVNNKQIIDKNELYKFKTTLFETIDMFIHYIFKDDYRKKIAYNDLCNYSRVLINNGEHEILNETFLKFLDKNNWELDEARYIFIVLIYLYYLSLKEELATQSQKEWASKILKEYQNDISNFLVMYSLSLDPINKNLIEDINNQVNGWEIMTEGEAKYCIIDGVVQEFFLFYILANIYDAKDLIEKLRFLISDNEFIFYNTYVGQNKERTRKAYEEFLKIFYARGHSLEESRETIDKFESVLINIYKLSEIEKAKEKNLPSESNFRELEAKLRNSILSSLTPNLELFNHKPPGQLEKYKQEIIRVNTFTAFLTERYELEYLLKEAKNQLVRIICYVIRDKVISERVSIKNKNMLEVFFELVNKVDIDLDTLIGYRNWFYGKQSQEDFQMFESKMKKVKADGINDRVFAVNRSCLFIELEDVDVNIDNLTEQEMIESARIDEHGKYLYNITNDIFLPFEKEELIEYLSNARKIVKVSFDINYGLCCDMPYIGAGIIITRE